MSGIPNSGTSRMLLSQQGLNMISNPKSNSNSNATSQTRSTFGTPRSTRYGTYRNGMMSIPETISSAKGTTGSNSPSSINKKPTLRYYTAPRLHTGQYADRLRELGFTSRDAVRDFLQKMIDAGYDLGKFGADGIWGDATEAAYQKYILPREMTKEELAQAEQTTQPVTTPIVNWNQPDSNYKLNNYTARGNFQRYGDNTFVGYFNRDQGRAMHNQGASYIDRNGVTHDMGNMNRFQINRLARRERRADINALNNISDMNTLNSATAYNPTKNMTYTYQQGGKMNDKQLQEAFIQFLAQKSGAKNEKELEAYVKQLGEDGLKQAYAEFTQAMQKQTQKAKQGAKLNYIRQLKHQCPEGQEPYYYKKGGMVNCGCKGVKMEDGGKTPKKQSAIEKFRARNTQQNNKNLKGDWQSQKAKEQQRKNREEAAKGEGESPVTDKNFNKGYKKNEKGGKFVKKGGKVKMGCK